VAVFGSPRMTNEEAWSLAHLARGALGGARAASFGLDVEDRVFSALRRAFGRAASTASYADLEAADTIVLLDADLAEEQTVAGIAVRRAVRRGARLVVVAQGDTRMARLAETRFEVNRGKLGGFLAAAAGRLLSSPERAAGLEGVESLKAAVASLGSGGVGDGPAAVAHALSAPGRAVLVASAASFDPATAGRDAALAVALAVLAGKGRGDGSGVLFLRMRANGQGLSDLGFGAGASRLLAEAERGTVRAALVVGEDPVAGAEDPARVAAALSKVSFLAVVDAVPTRTTKIASVVLPGAAFAEVSGTCTNSEGRVRLAQGPLSPPGGLTTLEVLSAIGERLGAPGPGACPTAVRARVAEDLASLGFPASPGPDGVLLRGAVSPASTGRVSVEVPSAEAPDTVLDPRFSDAIEVLFSGGARRLGLRAHVARPWPVSA